MKILLIENDKLFAQTALAALIHTGHEPKWAASAAAALLQADIQKPDLVILELNLAGHNGVEFLYEFRSYTEWQHIPIVIYSWVPRAAVKISPSVWHGLNIAGYYYKPETTLKKLLANLSKSGQVSPYTPATNLI